MSLDSDPFKVAMGKVIAVVDDLSVVSRNIFLKRALKLYEPEGKISEESRELLKKLYEDTEVPVSPEDRLRIEKLLYPQSESAEK